MESTDLRKIQEMGGGTSLISLPKSWVKKNNLKRGSVVSIESSSDRLIISPHSSEQRQPKEITLEYPPKHLHILLNDITAAYLLGYNIIRIAGKDRVSYSDRDTIKNTMKFLMGLEIVEEDAYTITIQFLLEPSNVHPDKLFMRMHAITSGMHKDLLAACIENDAKLLKDIRGRDDEVDRLYFLLVRIIRSAIQDPTLAVKFGMSPIDCLDYRVAANVLEAIGDASAKATEISEANFRFSEGDKNLLNKLGSMLGEIQDSAVKSFLTKKASEARKVLELHDELKEKIARYNARASFMGELLSAMNSVSRLCVDIADLAVPLYPTVR
jgi:phosphate uptake regulator